MSDMNIEVDSNVSRLYDAAPEDEQAEKIVEQMADVPESMRDDVKKLLSVSPLTAETMIKEVAKNHKVSATVLRDAIKDMRSEESATSTGCVGSSGTLAGMIVELVRPTTELFHDYENEGYARISRNGHQEVHPLSTKAFRSWVGYQTHTNFNQPLTDDTWKTVRQTLHGIAQYEGELRKVELRVACREDRYYLDLCNDDWQVVEITTSGWKILDESPVLFRRTQVMLPIPTPIPDGNINNLWNFINIPKDERTLYLAALIEGIRADTQYPVMSIQGGEGSGKTSIAKDGRKLIDPVKAMTRSTPTNIRDLHVGAANNHMLVYENLSEMKQWLSDGFCRIALGSGSAERELYTNLEERVIEYKRPILFDGIPFLLTFNDLIDRAVHFAVEPIERRIGEREYAAKFEDARPALLGAILDVMVTSLAWIPHVKLKYEARMLDFSRLGCAVHKVLGDDRDFSELLYLHQKDVRQQAIEQSPAMLALIDYLDRGFKVEDETPGDLLSTLRVQRDVSESAKGWPTSGKGMANTIQRYRKTLLECGYTVERGERGMRGTKYTITKVEIPAK